MILQRSKVTSQGQISIPAEVRKKLGVSPGSILEWDENDGKITVRRAGTFSSEDIHRALFPDQPLSAYSLEELKEGIKNHIRERHARGRY
jgi:AbrB family looped-hinge helix DNA binding protein